MSRISAMALSIFSLIIHVACGGGSDDPTSSTPSTNTPTATDSDGWSDPLSISSSSGGAEEVQIAIDDAGNAIAVWLQLNSSGAFAHSLWWSRYSGGSSWSDAELLESSDGDVGEFTLTMNQTLGRATVVFSQLGTSSNDLWARTFAPSSGWDEVASLEANPGAVTETSAAIDDDGNTAVIWSQATNSRFHVYANRHVPGSGWETATLVETHDVVGDSDTGARLAMLTSGDVLAVWQRSTGTSTSLWANSYHSGWGTESLLVADAGSTFSLDVQQALVADDMDGALLVWGQWQYADGQNQSTVVAKRYTASWEATSVEIAAPVDDTTISAPFVAMNADGEAAVLWQRGDKSLQASVADATGTWGEPYASRPAGSRDLRGAPATAIDDNGNVFATWAISTSSVGEADLIVQRYGASSGWEAPETLHTLAIDAQAAAPALAVNADGAAMLAYIETTSTSGSRVVVRRYVVP